MPKGVVHYAQTETGSEAYHLTIGLHRQNLQWLDVLHRLLTRRTDGPDDERDESVRVPIELMQIYSETQEGVHLHDVIPAWLLACHRPQGVLQSVKQWLDASGCNGMREELQRLLRLHVGRFGDWALRKAQEGPWKLASGVADKEKRVGQPADLTGVGHLFWWDGDLAFLRALQPDRQQLDAALTWMAEVIDYHNTTRNRWVRRNKRGGSLVARRSGDKPLGAPTLCDEMSGWSSECRGSDADRCEAYVENTTSCETYCEGQGMWCEGGYDDRDGGCERRDEGRKDPKGIASCKVSRQGQICRCRRECVNEGPWECTEQGCPARTVDCKILGVACGARFNDIWRKPVHGIEGVRYIQQACPLACGKCASPRSEWVDPTSLLPVWLRPPALAYLKKTKKT